MSFELSANSSFQAYESESVPQFVLYHYVTDLILFRKWPAFAEEGFKRLKDPQGLKRISLLDAILLSDSTWKRASRLNSIALWMVIIVKCKTVLPCACWRL